MLRKMAIRPCGHRLPNIVSVVCKKNKQISTQGSARVKTGVEIGVTMSHASCSKPETAGEASSAEASEGHVSDNLI